MNVKRAEASTRLEILRSINGNVYNWDLIQSSPRISVVESKTGKCRAMTPEEASIAKDFGKRTKSYVYFSNRTKLKDKEVLNLFFISDDRSQWDKEAEELINWLPTVYQVVIGDESKNEYKKIYVDQTLNQVG